MAKYEVSGPNGSRYEITAPDEMPEADVLSRFRREVGASPAPTVAQATSDVARQVPIGFNQGIDNLLNLPGDLLIRAPARALGLEQYVPARGSYATRFNPGGSLNVTSTTSDEPTTTAGRYANSVGGALGASAIPAGALMTAAPRLATMAATTVPRAVGQRIGAQIAANPAAAVGADVVAATGSGIAQEGAKDAGFGPLGQSIAGIAGGMAPLAAAHLAGGAFRTLAASRANADPYARVASGLGERTVDDLADAVAVGTTRQDLAINRSVLDTLGEEMVRSGGNRVAAVQATEARLVANGVAPATAADQVRRVLNAQSGNNLVLGEFPAVAGSNMATRERLPYAPRSQAGRNATDIFQEEFIRAGGDTAAAERATLDRLVAAGVPRQNASRYVQQITRGRVTDTELSATTEPGTQQQMDYVANTGTMASSQGVRASITQRAANLGDRMLALVRGLSPGGRTIRDVENMVAQLRQRARADYDVAHNTPGAVNEGALYAGLNRVIARHLAALRGRGGEQAAALRKAIDEFYVGQSDGGVAGQAAAAVQPNVLSARIAIPVLQEDLAAARLAMREARRQGQPKNVIDDMSRDVDDIVERIRVARRDSTVSSDRALPTSLQVVQDARTAVRNMITKAESATNPDPNTVAALRPFYRDVTRVMERASPAWAQANRRWADLRLDEIGAELGDTFAKGAGPRLRQQLRDFQQLAPEAQDVVRVHFTQKLLDEAEHEIRLAGQTNLGKLFDRQDKRNMIRAILGDDAANTLVRATRDANVMARSQAGIRGSQTHIRGQVQREQDADINTMAAAANFDLRSWKEEALQRVIAMWRERRNRVMGRALTTPMRDVPAVAEQIERMRRASDRVRAVNTPVDRQLPLSGVWAPAINPLLGD